MLGRSPGAYPLEGGGAEEAQRETGGWAGEALDHGVGAEEGP